MKSRFTTKQDADTSALSALRKKIGRAAAAALFDEPGMSGASALVMGCAMSTLYAALEQDDSPGGNGSISVSLAIRGLLSRGVDAVTARTAIDLLVDRDVFKLQGDELIIPSLKADMGRVLKSFENRREGWKKRLAQKEQGATQAAAANAVAPKQQTPGRTEQVDLAGTVPAKPKAAIKKQGVLCGQQPQADDSMVCTMITDGGETYTVMQSYVAEASKIYPAVDVEQQLLQAAAWLGVNPAKRKTARGMPRFINTWLSNAQRDASMRKVVAGPAAAPRNGFGQGSISDLQSMVVTAAIGAPKDPLDGFADLDGESFTAPTGGDVILADDGRGFDAADQGLDAAQAVQADSAGLVKSEAEEFDINDFLGDPANTGSFSDGDLGGSTDIGGDDLDDGLSDMPTLRGFLNSTLAA